MSHLNAFKAHRKELEGLYYLTGDCLLVEEIPKAEVKTKSGLVLSSGGRKSFDGMDMNQPLFVRVLDKGPGFYDEETGDSSPLEVEVGDIILIGKVSVQFFSTFGPLVSEPGSQIGLTRESEIRMRFKGQEAWDKACEVLVRERGNVGE